MGSVVKEHVFVRIRAFGRQGSNLVAGIGDRLSSRRAIPGGGGHREQQQWNRRRQRQSDCGQEESSRHHGALASSAVVERKRADLGLIRAQASLAEADEINWAVSASFGTLQMIEADYQFDVNFA